MNLQGSEDMVPQFSNAEGMVRKKRDVKNIGALQHAVMKIETAPQPASIYKE